jgi:MoaA/NifB/PqqE/SkfB family radical SAM enzyme
MSSPSVDTTGELSTTRLLELIDELEAIGVLELSIAGGEPLLHPDWAVLVERAVAVGVNVVLTTNGHLIDDGTVAVLARAQPLDVRVSFDGGPRMHDHVRGRGSYDKALAGTAQLAAAGINATGRLTLCQGGGDELTVLFDDLVAAGVHRAKVALAKRAGRAATVSGGHLVVDDLDPSTPAALEALGRERGISVKLAADDFEVEITGGDMSKIRDVDRPNCGAGFESCHITPRGELLGCAAIPDISFGTLATHRFLEVWDGQTHHQFQDGVAGSPIRRLCDFVNGVAGPSPVAPPRRKRA